MDGDGIPKVTTVTRVRDAGDVCKWRGDHEERIKNLTLCVHFLDHDCTAVDLNQLNQKYNVRTADSNQETPRQRKILRDVLALSVLTDGMLVSWSGHKTHDEGQKANAMHKILTTIVKDKNIRDFQIAKVSESQSCRSLVVAVATLNALEQKLSEEEEGKIVKERVSESAHYTLLTTKPVNNQVETLGEWITAEHLTPQDKIVVCVLVEGGLKSIKAAAIAVQKQIPVIILKGSGGLADILCGIYHQAKLRPTKRRVGNKVRTVMLRQAPSDTMRHIRRLFHSSQDASILDGLETLIRKLHLLTVYDPSGAEDSLALDCIILEALIKNSQEHQLEVYLHMLWRRRSCVNYPPSVYTPSFVESSNERLQLDCFLQSLQDGSPSAVTAFLHHLKGRFVDFHLGRLLTLYSQDVRFLRTEKIPEAAREDPYERFKQARRDLKTYAGRWAAFFLICKAPDSCPHCNLAEEGQMVNMFTCKERFLQTCLSPLHELFLWALLSGNCDLAQAFWLRCPDHLMTALFARCFFYGVRKKQQDKDVKQELKEYSRRFEDLAVSTLQAALEMDEKGRTQKLLALPRQCWGGASVFTLALLTKSKRFVAHSACRKHLDRLWRGYRQPEDVRTKTTEAAKNPPLPNSPSGSSLSSVPAVAVRRSSSVLERLKLRFTLHPQKVVWLKRPVVRFWCCAVWQMAFLLLYSYMVLFDFGLTWTFVAVCICVLDTFFVELMQACTGSTYHHLGSNNLKLSWSLRLRSYLSQSWNRLDLLSLLLFLLSFLLLHLAPLLSPPTSAHTRAAARVLMATDVVVFVLRFLQTLLVFPEQGLLLLMAQKMVWDSLRFMVILLSVLFAYTVWTESVLYGEMSFTWDRLFYLPHKAFWQVFGELSLDEIHKENCGKGELCPSKLSQYLVPVMLGVYMVITNVLLLNLLIARFGVTFSEVRETAEHHLAWQRSQLVKEFEDRSFLPPPFNAVHAVLIGCRGIMKPLYGCLCRCCCKKEPCGCCKGKANSYEMKPLVGKSSQKGRCIHLSWKENFNKCEITTENTNNVICYLDSYDVSKGNRRLIVWMTDPTMSVRATFDHISDPNHYTTSPGHASNLPPISDREQRELDEFEREQAAWAAHQLDQRDSD